MLRVLTSLLACMFLVACTADNKWAPDADVARARYVDPNPPSITLMTSINTRTKSGAHTGLLINGSERVLYDPAGSWEHPAAPERADLHYGMSPALLSFYVDYQGTAPFELVQQTVYVSQAVADRAIQEAIAHGAANKSQCTNATIDVLHSVPGFENLPHTYFPKALSKEFAKVPGVVSRVITSKDGNLRRTLPGATFASAAPTN